MTQTPSRIRLAAPAVACVLLLAACSEPAKVQPSTDPVLLSRLEELEQRLRDVEDSADLAVHAGSGAGLQAQSIGDRLTRIENVVAELQRVRAATVTSGDAPVAVDPVPPAGSGSPDATGGAGLLPVPTDQPIPEEQIAYYRRLEEEVRRRRTEEQQIERFKRDLARSQAVLTPEQEAALIKVESAYAAKLRELYRNPTGDGQRDRDTLNQKRQVLFTEFEAQVRATIPDSEADKVIKTLQDRNRGFYGGAPRTRIGGMDTGGEVR